MAVTVLRPQMKGLLSLVVACAFFLNGCSNLRNVSWPSELPDKAYFIEQYQRDLDNQARVSLSHYLAWVRRFYLGWRLYPIGWQKTSNKIITSIDDPSHRASAEEKTKQLGLLVSAEWAKHNDLRLIDTRLLSLWGHVLSDAIHEQKQLEMLDQILKDSKDILAGSLDPTSIDQNHYSLNESTEFGTSLDDSF